MIALILMTLGCEYVADYECDNMSDPTAVVWAVEDGDDTQIVAVPAAIGGRPITAVQVCVDDDNWMDLEPPEEPEPEPEPEAEADADTDADADSDSDSDADSDTDTDTDTDTDADTDAGQDTGPANFADTGDSGTDDTGATGDSGTDDTGTGDEPAAGDDPETPQEPPAAAWTLTVPSSALGADGTDGTDGTASVTDLRVRVRDTCSNW